jgi:acyl-CoA thioester hydrolase
MFVHRLQVRFRDCDPMGHVNNAVYLTYLEETRFAHWRSIWKYRQDGADARVPGVILARSEIDYRAQAREGDVLEIRMHVAHIGRTSFHYQYEIFNRAGEVVVQAKTVQVMYDYAAARPIPVPDDIREMLGQV